MINFKQFLEDQENSSQQDVRQDIFNSSIPDNLKELFKAVNNYNRQSDRNTLFHLMPKYDNMDLPNLDSHGISKISRSFQLNSLIKFLEDGKIPTSMHSAPLLKGRNESFGAGMGTGSGTAYRDGLFIIVASPGKTLHEEIKYVIVDGQVADAKFQDNGMNPTQFLQKELGKGKYIFIDGGENNNQLESFFSKIKKSNPQEKSNPQQEIPIETNNPLDLQKIGIKPDEAEMKSFPNNIIGVRNRKKKSYGFGKMHYFDKNKSNLQDFIRELKISFDLIFSDL
jgi:hypothetical protein